MNDQHTPMTQEQESCEILATLVATLGAKTYVAGMNLMSEGYETDNPALKREGLKMILEATEYLAAASMSGIDVEELLRMEYEDAHSDSAS